MKRQLHLSLLVVAFAIGCQKTPTATSDLTGSVAMQSTNCQNGPTTDASIVGLSGVKSGQKAMLALSSGVNCQDAMSAQWKIGDVVVGSGPQVQAQINGTGIYNVSVVLSSPSSTSQNKTVANQALTSGQVAVTNSEILIVGPQLAYQDQDYQYSLTVPSGVTLVRALWDFGDGSPVVSSLSPVNHAFPQGTYTITVSTVDSNNQSQSIRQSVQVLPMPEGKACALDQLAINGPVDVPVARPVSYSVNLSTCLASQVSQVIWNFGDGTPAVNSLNPRHAFQTPGSYTITAQITLYGHVVTLTRDVIVKDNLETMPGPVDPSTGSGGSNSGQTTDPSSGSGSGSGSGSSGSDSGSVSDPSGSAGSGSSGSGSSGSGSGSGSGADPVPDNNKCPTLGATRTSDGAQSTQSHTCGLNGTRTDTYKTVITETCQSVNGIRDWVQTSTSQVLVSEGACQSQSCELITANGKEILKDGESRTLYTNQTPAGSCSSVQEVRVCHNGVISGSSAAQYTSCHNGCGDFGSHGTVKTSVVTGEIQQPVTCQFGETGVISTYNQVSDLSCQDGQVVTSNTHQGDVKTAGVCPTYSWVPTENWTQCSADCGGTQDRIYECRNDKGEVSPSERCQGAAPLESRICDGNPEAAKRIETSTSEEDAPSCGRCPANQIGVITQHRDVTVTKTYACIDHQVQLADTQTNNGAWVTEKYCRDFVPMRCSEDSLGNDEAHGRYAWMVKCQEEIPAVKEFLTEMDKKKWQGIGIKGSERLLYPTFMDSKYNTPWIAPTSKKASCKAPSHAYVAAVCVSSCATPEQQILVEAEHEKKLKYVPFIEALTQKVPKVATLQSASTMSSKTVVKTQVDNWVTELLDGDHQILVFRMQSGGILKLTLNHPLLTQEGYMKLASDFKVGESLVLLGGKLDPIVSIEQTVHHGKVYNLFVKSSDLKHNVVVTNGYLNGTAFYQNEGAKFMNRDLFRSQLYRGAFNNKGQ